MNAIDLHSTKRVLSNQIEELQRMRDSMSAMRDGWADGDEKAVMLTQLGVYDAMIKNKKDLLGDE